MTQANYGYAGDIREIRRCLELQMFEINGVNIKAIYQSQLKDWWNERLKDVRNEALKLQKDGFKIICIGGGVALPNFIPLLKVKKFAVVDQAPELASARGLYRLALTQAKKKACQLWRRHKMTDKSLGERVRIKAKYTEIVRKIAAIREESFIDALYRIIDFYWDNHRGLAPTKSLGETKSNTSQPTQDAIDLSEFE